jgi:uncharacterized protein
MVHGGPIDLMILEGIVTTLNPKGRVHISPMGPRVDPTIHQLLLRPFSKSQTYRNLFAHGEGVLHVTDDVMLLARAAIGQFEAVPPHVPANKVKGFILSDVCRYFEFRVSSIDDREERVQIEAEVVHTGRFRDFFGFNRAKNAVVEAAILATRTAFLPMEDVDTEFRRLAIIVEKTGGAQEHAAFAVLRDHVEKEKAKRSGGSR